MHTIVDCGLTSDEIKRYSRQIICDELIGFGGQVAFKNSKVLIVGCGGLGSVVGLYLTGAGIGSIDLIDDDVVEAQNLQRQIIHNEFRVGMNKAVSAAESISALNPSVSSRVFEQKIGDISGLDLSDYTVIADCTDNSDAHAVISRLGNEYRVPVVWASVVVTKGQLTVLHPDGPCFDCLVPVADLNEENGGMVVRGATHGILGPSAGMIGCMQATEVMKVIKFRDCLDRTLLGKMVLVDCLNYSIRRINITKREKCAVCGTGGTLEAGSTMENPNDDGAIDARELKLIGSDYSDRCLLIDVRSPSHFGIAHISGSVNIPFENSQDLESWFVGLQKRISPRTESVILISVSGFEAKLLVERFSRTTGGHFRMKYLTGGLRRWKSVDPSFPLY